MSKEKPVDTTAPTTTAVSTAATAGAVDTKTTNTTVAPTTTAATGATAAVDAKGGQGNKPREYKDIVAELKTVITGMCLDSGNRVDDKNPGRVAKGILKKYDHLLELDSSGGSNVIPLLKTLEINDEFRKNKWGQQITALANELYNIMINQPKELPAIKDLNITVHNYLTTSLGHAGHEKRKKAAGQNQTGALTK